MKRLTAQQKRQAVFSVLSNFHHSMTSAEIGKKIGFQNGVPVASTLCDLHDTGEAVHSQDLLNTGTEIYLWRLTQKGRDAAWAEFEIRPFDYSHQKLVDEQLK